MIALDERNVTIQLLHHITHLFVLRTEREIPQMEDFFAWSNITVPDINQPFSMIIWIGKLVTICKFTNVLMKKVKLKVGSKNLPTSSFLYAFLHNLSFLFSSCHTVVYFKFRCVEISSSVKP